MITTAAVCLRRTVYLLLEVTSVSRSVSSREVRLQEKDGVNPAFKLCPVKCREVTVKKKRVETNQIEITMP